MKAVLVGMLRPTSSSLITRGRSHNVSFVDVTTIACCHFVNLFDASVEFGPQMGKAYTSGMHFRAQVFLELRKRTLANFAIARLLRRHLLNRPFHNFRDWLFWEVSQFMPHERIGHKKWRLTGTSSAVQFGEPSELGEHRSEFVVRGLKLDERSLQFTVFSFTLLATNRHVRPFLASLLKRSVAALVVFNPHNDLLEEPHCNAEFLSTLEHVTCVVGRNVMLSGLF